MTYNTGTTNVDKYSNANRILLLGEYKLEEGLAGGTITPGMLVERYNAAGDEKLRVHSVAGGFGEKMFAIEDPEQGKTVSSSQSRGIEDNYVAGERVQLGIMAPGSRVQARLKDGENVVIGDQLISAGDGTLKKVAGTPTQVFAIALEPLDLTASSNTAPGLIDVVIL